MSTISWTQRTWNPVTGCTKVSEGCRYCYAEAMAKRLRGRHGYDAVDPFKVALHHERLREPLTWRKPTLCFVCSMGDLFHEDVPDEMVAAVMATCYKAEQHTFQILTKRPARMAEMTRGCLGQPIANLWLGTSCEDQDTFDARVPHLLKCTAAVRFVSLEPLLDEIILGDKGDQLDWIIIGCESRGGRHGRLFAPDTYWCPGDVEVWYGIANNIINRCLDRDIAVFVKQVPTRDGAICKDISQFPASLRYQQYPADRGLSEVKPERSVARE